MNTGIRHTPEYWREHYRLDEMEIGARQDVAGTAGWVSRVRPREYILRHIQNHERARWGTAEEIASDIAYLEEWGTLPKAEGGRW